MMVDRNSLIKKALISFATVASVVGASLAVSNAVFAGGASAGAPASDTVVAEPAPAAKKTKEELMSQGNIVKVSEAYGHFIAKSLNNPVLTLDFSAVIRGMNDAKGGKPSPMTEQEYEDMITQLQELSFQEAAAKNLQDAEAFLAENAKKPSIVVLDGGKVQILTEQAGSGDEVVSEAVVPVIHYTGSYLNGTVFGSSKESKEPISISLNQTIPGFKKGILGMKIGEKRRIFIHPEEGYGTSGQLMPNALLIFDVEPVKMAPPSQELDEVGEDDEELDDFDTALADDDADVGENEEGQDMEAGRNEGPSDLDEFGDDFEEEESLALRQQHANSKQNQ